MQAAHSLGPVNVKARIAAGLHALQNGRLSPFNHQRLDNYCLDRLIL
jgi:hypothetical protein